MEKASFFKLLEINSTLEIKKTIKIEIIKIEREYETSYSKACLNLKYVYLVNKKTYF